MIKKSIALFILLIFIGITHSQATTQARIEPLLKHRISTLLITKFVTQYHYMQSKLDDEKSAEIFDEYLKTLDPNRNIFTQSDIKLFSRFKVLLDDAILQGNMDPAFIIFRTFNERRIERANFALSLLDQKFDFSKDETYVFDRENAPWAENKRALDEIWRKRVKNDYLTLLLADKKDEDIKKTLRKRYKRIIKRAEQLNSEDVYEVFINVYLRNLEPHTAYFSPRTSENFNINMSLSLEGIGAVLETIDEYTVVRRVVKGGPADLSKQLHAGDKIIGVGQGDGEVEDVIGWRLDDVVDKIRGPKDTVVQLHIIPEHSGPGSTGEYISIVRNKIKLEDQKVKKAVIEIPDGPRIRKIGVIEIPTFYMDFEASVRGEKDYSSTTRDTRKIINELKAEGVEGIVVDLRQNGGGSLVEAISLTGLFIEQGPVVQIKKSNGAVEINEDEDASVAYAGPLAVLVNRNSASASEIFSGAIQDYGRGVIIGEPTFGKGTVQTLINLNKYIKEKSITLGQLKITMAQFFRVNGDSTQFLGVVPDIVFPTAVESEEQGERSLEHAIPWAKISAANYSSKIKFPTFLDEAKAKHQVRVKSDTGFSYLMWRENLRREVMEKNELSLLKSKRESLSEQQKVMRHEQLNKFRVSRGMKAVSLKEDVVKEDSTSEKLSEELYKVPVRESANILVDLINASRSHSPQLSVSKNAASFSRVN